MPQTFEEKITEACANSELLGAAVCAVSIDDSFSYSKAFGVSKLGSSDSDGKSTPFALDTMLRVASCTKLLTNIAALQCVEKGLIELDDDVSPLLPNLAKQKVIVKCTEDEEVLEERREKITLSGAFGSYDVPVKKWRERHNQLEPMWKASTLEVRYDTPLGFQPGTSWGYGSGHDWAGRVVEILTKQTLDHYFQDNICTPLGLTSTTFFPDQRPGLAARLADFMRRDNATGKVVPAPDWPPYKHTDCFGGGGLCTTMPDYLKVLRSLLRNDGILLKPSSHEILFSPQLGEASRKALVDLQRGEFGDGGPGYYSPEVPLTWGLGAMLSLSDDPRGEVPRSEGTLTWAGYPNLFWFVDRKKGLAGVFGTALLPSGDKLAKEITTAWEWDMYRKAGLA